MLIHRRLMSLLSSPAYVTIEFAHWLAIAGNFFDLHV